MGTRAKFYCQSVEAFAGDRKKVVLSAIYDPHGNAENANFTKATPEGQINMTIDNPAASVQFKPGKYYTVDFNETE